jgi:hypothetical protein
MHTPSGSFGNIAPAEGASDEIPEMLAGMALVEQASASMNTVSWVWGGWVSDIYAGRVLRSHHDVDFLTLHLRERDSEIAAWFVARGWTSLILANGDLGLRRPSVKMELGRLELGVQARWMHNGEKGSLWFPRNWLQPEPVAFCGRVVHVVQPELQYVLLEHPELLNPAWKPRPKDLADRESLRLLLQQRGVDPSSLFAAVRAENS